MRSAIVLVASLALVACMQKQADGTYRVPMNSDTAKARNNAARAGDAVRKATDEIAHSQVAKKVEHGLGKVATKAGEKLQQVGAKVQADASKRH